ncbi:unnamed protein product [Schistocephalus solidus]|uniref:SAP domain-containing protein n=1 Tax=Schistocephalus solidus TaxID=70667 RepID=A0A183TT92_SCHSO|nr:unnamed protein product [Schistocephalus solidus]
MSDKEVSKLCMASLWPEGVPELVTELRVHRLDDIVALGKIKCLKGHAADVQELVQELSGEGTTKELMEIQKELKQYELQELSSGEKVDVREYASLSMQLGRDVNVCKGGHILE